MGKDFSCKFCGQCCEGKGGIVVSKADLNRLCAFLKLTADAFEKNYAEKRMGKLYVRSGQDGRCVFFVEEKGCAVHPAKPNICRAWPYFRGNLLDKHSLELAKDSCPGIDKDIDLKDFRSQGIAYLQKNNLLASSSLTEARALCIDDIIEMHTKAHTLAGNKE